MARVLCIGLDDAAMTTRKLILEKAGHSVTQARDLRKVKAECEENSFSIAVLGQSLNENEKMRVADVVLSLCKGAKILELHTGIQPQLPSCRCTFTNCSQPENLVGVVDKLLRLPRKKKARQVT